MIIWIQQLFFLERAVWNHVFLSQLLSVIQLAFKKKVCASTSEFFFYFIHLINYLFICFIETLTSNWF